MSSERPAETAPSKRRQVLKSILPHWLHVMLRVALVLAAFMLANTLYLLINRAADALGWSFFAAGDTTLPSLFQVMILTHTGVGLLVAAATIFFVVLHLPKVWKRYHPASVWSGIGIVAVGLSLVITGLFILTAAASRDNSWAWWIHVISAAVIPIGYIAHRVVSYTRPANAQFARFFAAVGVAMLVLVAGHGLTNREVVLTEEARAARAVGLSTGPGSRARDVSAYLEARFVPTGFVPPQSPFFPSAATTTSGGLLPSRIITRGHLGVTEEEVRREVTEQGFVTDALIGAETCERCHQDITRQWAASAHRFASFNNPFYEATINVMRDSAVAPNRWVDQHMKSFPEADGVGRVKSKWCSGCHDPALMLAGKMDEPVDRATVAAQAGLTCLACHAIDAIHDRTGNGNYNIADEQEDPYVFADAGPGSVGAFLHDAAIKARPEVHKRLLMQPFFQTGEFCATCHKVSLTEPVNNYRWLRGQDEFDNWDDSGVALNASRTFYLPPKRRVCQDCHMPPEPAPLGDVAAENGMVRSHRFVAVNTALPFVRGDDETLDRIEAFLRDEKLSVDIFALRSRLLTQPIMAIDDVQPQVAAGEVVTVDVVVRNKGVGHTFPGGTNDSNEGWLEVSVSDETGRQLAISGFIDPTGHLDPEAHAFKAVILDRNGNRINRRNAQDIFVTVFANVIGPGTSDVAHYEFRVPESMSGKTLTVTARLLWRKFDRDYTVFAYEANPEGFTRFAKAPDLPITEIAADQVRLAVVDGRTAATRAPSERGEQWFRFNDYGIGLLLEEDTRGAAVAFERVAALRPDLIEGHLNLARTALRDGNLAVAFDHLQQVEGIEVANARAAWVWGVALQEDGRYEQAVAAYRRVLEEFPKDRATWRNLGRTYYLDQRYEEALEALDRVLEIDPEDRVAHYHRMLSLRALGRETDAEEAAAAYAHYSIDESAQEVTRAFRQRNPGANLMAQGIRTHRLKMR